MNELLAQLLSRANSQPLQRADPKEPWFKLPGALPDPAVEAMKIRREAEAPNGHPSLPGYPLRQTRPLVVPGEGGLGDIANHANKSPDEFAKLLIKLMDDLNR